MRRIRVPSKITRTSTKLGGAQRSPELALRSMDFRAPEKLIFSALKGAAFSEKMRHSLSYNIPGFSCAAD